MARRKFINAKLKGYNELQEILVEDGVFKKIAPSIEVAADCEVEDLGGKLTLYSRQESRELRMEQVHCLKEYKDGVKPSRILL